MKIKIINNTNLNFATIGQAIDKIIASGDEGDTHYYGQIEWTILEINGKVYGCQIRYLKRYVEWIFREE